MAGSRTMERMTRSGHRPDHCGMGMDSRQNLAIATVASGPAASFTTTYTGLHYLGIMVQASQTPALLG